MAYSASSMRHLVQFDDGTEVSVCLTDPGTRFQFVREGFTAINGWYGPDGADIDPYVTIVPGVLSMGEADAGAGCTQYPVGAGVAENATEDGRVEAISTEDHVDLLDCSALQEVVLCFLRACEE